LVRKEQQMSTAPERLTAEVNGINISFLSQGDGPLVIFMHGFPELAISWRHQLEAVAGAGYRGVAPDMRGFGATDAPADPEVYSQFHIAGDIIGLMDQLGEKSAVIVGHDIHANTAWSMALTTPHRVRGIAALSIPFKPRGGQPPLATPPPVFYQKRFQELEVPEKDLHDNVRTFLPGIFDRLSGSSELGNAPTLIVPDGKHFSDLFPAPSKAPVWLGEELLDEYIETYERTGFRGAVNFYRNIDRNWYLSAPWATDQVSVPAAYVVGTKDVAYGLFHDTGVIAGMSKTVPQLLDSRVLEGVGHWIGQEAPAEVNEFLLAFLAKLEA
jgi:pimeloyl-ACP methyl ester carboxylesterase